MKTQDTVLICLPTEEAIALVELGAALEPFIAQGSPADRATARLDEQVAQQSRDRGALIRHIKDEMEDVFYDFNELPDRLLLEAATRAVDQMLGYYGDDTNAS